MKYSILVGISKEVKENNTFEMIHGSYDKAELKEEKECNAHAFKKMKIITLENGDNDTIINTLNALNGVQAQEAEQEETQEVAQVEYDIKITFRTSEGKNGKLNYSRFYINSKGKVSSVRAMKEDFEKYQSKALNIEVSQDGRFTIYNFFFNRK